MTMAAIDLSFHRASLLGDATVISLLPLELRQIIESQQPTDLLDAVAQAALVPRLTGRIFAHFEAVFSDVCARWTSPTTIRFTTYPNTIAAFARTLPFAPYLSSFLNQFFANTLPGTSLTGEALTSESPFDLSACAHDELILLTMLVALWRLNSFDKRSYSRLSQPSQVQNLFSHANPAVRYLAIRVFCQVHDAADVKMDSLLKKYIRESESLWANLDGKEVDYTFLSLYEQSRVEEIQALRRDLQAAASLENNLTIPPQNLTALVLCYGNTVLPRPLGPVNTHSSLIHTPTTVQNLERFISLLKIRDPVLLHGISGSGKTSLVHEVARELGKENGLVTLHLNEQTDAKVLLGLYATDLKPGSFHWRPGVLTTAVKEGRWVLIEDLDRAPTEVMSTLLPLVERGELLIPSRGERIQAADGFRIFATTRTSLDINNQEALPSIIGLRLWQCLPVKPLSQEDLGLIINDSYPLLHKYTQGLLTIFEQLQSTTSGSGRLYSGRGIVERPISTRDLFKWCRRLDSMLHAAGCTSGKEPISETTKDRMFMDAVDCFASCLKDARTRSVLVQSVAKEMHISEDRVQHYLTNYIPDLKDDDLRFSAGRVSFVKQRPESRLGKRTTKPRRPFASTRHAKRLLEQIAVAVKLKEPVLLVGETGIGKTTVVQQLAEALGHKLVAVNLSQQSEAGDLLGGFKPVSSRSLAVPLKEEFEELFERTGISAEKNQEYIERINKRFVKKRWSEVSKEWRKASEMFGTILAKLESASAQDTRVSDAENRPAKCRKIESSKLQRLMKLKPRWEAFSQKLGQFDRQIAGGSGAFAFAFVEGQIVKAARNGDWVLLDEINLAPSETLESISGLLQSGPTDAPSLLLSETGEIERVAAHPNFRVFGAMNPATDVGKKDLPLGLRSRFTEIYVGSPDRDKKDLLTIIKTYLHGSDRNVDRIADSVADLYLELKQLTESKQIVDGANEVPHISLRTLTRVLTYANDVSLLYNLDRALFEGFCMGFLTLLSQESEKVVMPRIQHHLLKRPTALTVPPRTPSDGRAYAAFTGEAHVSSSSTKRAGNQYWLLQGSQVPIDRPDYIFTPYVQRNLLNLVRATSTRRYPILIQGPTSCGKTSMIEYLANVSGNKFVRINNHEHTDLQEYLGAYVSGCDGKLKFQEGLLVQAMRQGSWIVLDELNLAPTDVLEALNRLLDDNRELLIPETQEVVRPHENFMLFATQNPPGLYGGRKILSRAFRNRFLELHFDDIPEDELQTILEKRSRNTAPSDCRRIVNVYQKLCRLRQESRVFEQKNSFATLRDLFRWALREADTRQDIADHGFMLLAERVRKPEERDAVREVIESVFKVKIKQEQLYGLSASPGMARANSQGVTWTKAMRRLYTLVRRAIQNNEPVLLVGETGCGKTTVCQLLAEAEGKELYIVNAHQNTETGDLIGSQRPVRNRQGLVQALAESIRQAGALLEKQVDGSVEDLLEWYHSLGRSRLEQVPEEMRLRIQETEHRTKALFEWCDGSLVQALKQGQFFLLDEISLADDSVLERLNSVLEPHRSLFLAEKGIEDSFVKAADGFQFFATMNPGGDFGKKELSPALRNRFTEIWVPAMMEEEDVHDIIVSKLDRRYREAENVDADKSVAAIIIKFAAWFGKSFRPSSATAFSLRDILAWVDFMNKCDTQGPEFALLHGAATVFVDTLGANPSALLSVDSQAMEAQRQTCIDKLSELSGCDLGPLYRNDPVFVTERDHLCIGGFKIARSGDKGTDADAEFRAPTTKKNAMRVIRALQVNKPVLLEGNPGVGKTTIVTAMARACGQALTRINLSDQTDLMDLFGTDVPVEGAEAGHFAWKDAPFLQAMQKGEWVLLDEMNLASQSVLEGLNACLDHRGEVYVSELDQLFKRHPDFRLFAAQNPHHQGGGRKGLPSSFVNRFIVVYADVLTAHDLDLITSGPRFDKIDCTMRRQMIDFISRLDDQVVVKRRFGAQGSPWEFNLRDTLRWLDLLTSSDPLISTGKLDDFLGLVIRQRFRLQRDRDEVDKLFAACFQRPPASHSMYHTVDGRFAQVGLGLVQRNVLSQPAWMPAVDEIARLAETESVLIAIKQNLPCILVGASGSGKTVLLHHVAALAGKTLVVFPLNADVDTTDLIGGFEQADPHRELYTCLAQLGTALQNHVLHQLPRPVSPGLIDFLRLVGVTQDKRHYKALQQAIDLLLDDSETPADLTALLRATHQRLGRPLTLENPRFEWLDAVIVGAVETGRWLVLDNANLCSASVLDRLNSLLERPDGFLGINEHSGPGGEPRIIRPHPDFRIFLTMDPRHGELSRAMRNRSVEIYLDGQPKGSDPLMDRIAPVEASLQRYRTAIQILSSSSGHGPASLETLAFDLISLADTSLLAKFVSAVDRGLGSAGLQSESTRQRLSQVLAYVQSKSAEPLQKALVSLYQRTWDASSLPLHPLNNAAIVPLFEAQAGTGLTYWLAAAYEIYLDLQTAWKSIEGEQRRCNDVTKLSSFNRLQRSLVSESVHSVWKDSTVKAASFLNAVLWELSRYLIAHLDEAGAWKERRSLARKLMVFWKQTLKALTRSSQQNFDEASFQAHLRLGDKLLQQSLSSLEEEGNRQLMGRMLSHLKDGFTVGFRLSTGLSMELLWLQLRPEPIRDVYSFEQVVAMERLAARFDALRWKTDGGVDGLANVMTSMAKVYAIIRHHGLDASQLVLDLQTEIAALESQTGEHARERPPFFAVSFESLRQQHTLYLGTHAKDLSEIPADLVLLSNTPTLSQMLLPTSKAYNLRALDYMLAQDDASRPWSGTIFQSLLLALDSVPAATLQDLSSLERELPVLGRVFTRSCEAITADSLHHLNHQLVQLIADIMGAHGQQLRDLVAELYQELMRHDPSPVQGADWDFGWLRNVKSSHGPLAPSLAHVDIIFHAHFYKALAACCMVEKHVGPRAAYAAIAWVQFAQGCIKLYVPDKIFDPYLRARVEMEYFQELCNELQAKIISLDVFERLFTGQPTNLRRELLLQELESVEQPASVQVVYRPTKAEKSIELQGEFRTVLNFVINNDISAAQRRSLSSSGGSDTAHLEMHTVKKNVARLVEHFSSRLKDYQDLTTPLVYFLRCLQVGLSLTDSAVQERAARESSSESAALMRITPMLGGTAMNLLDASEMSVRSFEFLSLAEAFVAVEGMENVPTWLRQALFKSLACFHEEWSKKLDADRKADEAERSLYRFKGSLEDEEEFDALEFDQLFPDYTAVDDQGKPRARRRAAQELSVSLGKAHESIFLTPKDQQAVLRRVCSQIARKFCHEKTAGHVATEKQDKLLLPAVLLALDEQVQAVKPTVGSTGHNFYEDANVPEVRKLLVLVRKSKIRFQYLQTVDEIGHHQALADVIMACDKILDTRVDEPLAKMIIDLERLHAFMYEWHEGGWASRLHKATELVDKLQDTICDWRKLELSSWSRLFDVEENRCRDEAKSWWFIAYGAVIFESCLRHEQGRDLREYAVELLQILESYFSEAMVGQFMSRLTLLKQLKRHLDLLILDGWPLAVIRNAMHNFISFYGRYEHQMNEAMRAGRAPLDRTMKDVLLLFRWSDRNIDALRESAQKSHRKLFKLVRKFRAVLAQPAKAILANGLPDDAKAASSFIMTESITAESLDVDEEAIALARKLVPRAAQQPQWERLANPATMTRIMAKHGTLFRGGLHAAEALDTYVSELVAAMAALRKETPATLTDDNKEQVKHLKTRKANLFADTLKALRQMGFSRSLGGKILDKQSSTQVLLVASGVVEWEAMASVEVDYFYFKTLDLAPKFRQAAVKFSDDLDRQSVQRSIGFLEGILHVMLEQRQYLVRAAQSADFIDNALAQLESMSARSGERALQRQIIQVNCRQVLRWLCQILQLAIFMVRKHAELGKIDSKEDLDQLSSWLAKFEAMEREQQRLPRLPAGLTSSRHEDLRSRATIELAGLEKDIEKTAQKRPDLVFVLQQVRLWTNLHITELMAEGPENSIETFADVLMNLSSKILVAIQDFQAAAQSLPTSVEDASWLVKHSKGLSKSIDALRVRKMGEEVDQVVHLVKSLDLDKGSVQLASACWICLLLPVLQQYAHISRDKILRFAELHRSTSRLGYHLSKSVVQLACHGFCTPQEKSDESSKDSAELEGGTGLGDGEGANDISKDIQPDEDLSELAQDPANKERDGEDMIEDEKDAVDMGDDELEGELGSVAGEDEDEEDEDDEGDKDEMEDGVGDVDDLDPTAVDEKMWDGENEDDADKDQQGDKAKGERKDEKVSAEKEGGAKEQPEDGGGEADEDEASEDGEGEDGDEKGEDQDEQVGAAPEEADKQNQHVQENDTLDLPEDMDIDGDDDASASDGIDEMDGLSDAEKADEYAAEDAGVEAGEEDEKSAEQAEDAPADERNETSEETDEQDFVMDTGGEEEKEEAKIEQQQDEEMERLNGEADKDKMPQPRDQGKMSETNAAPSDVQGGSGEDDEDVDGQDDDGQAQSKATRRDRGTMGENAANREATSGSKEEATGQDQEEQTDAEDSQPFKKLGDALERWYRGQKDIQEAELDQDAQRSNKKENSECDMARAEFQHLQDENAAEDTQALGTATEDEARPMDEDMAIETEMEDDGQSHMHPDADVDEKQQAQIDPKVDQERQEQQAKAVTDPQDDVRASVSTRRGALDRDEDDDFVNDAAELDHHREHDQLQQTCSRLSSTHVDLPERQLRPYTSSLELWTAVQSKTQALSLALTSQLRLILTPSQSTKLSGAFRTGKRLNIKRIIPYIASSYKRDKIWMRRAVPTKRSYQMLLCVDDSSSMGDAIPLSSGGSSPGTLALESLVMVSRALHLLEVGQIGVLGFGDSVFAAHDLLTQSAAPFGASPEAGARALQQFTFSQPGTDVVALLQNILQQFRASRARQTAQQDLWQLALVLSDGLVQKHSYAKIRPLLRAALEERVMVVFIVLDHVKGAAGSGSREAESVLELREARFVPGTGEVVIESYLESFPFPYYLVVRELADLPGALAGLLRTWFAEVNA